MAELLYHAADGDPRSLATLAFMLEVIGIPSRPASPPELWAGPHLVYGTEDPRPNGILIRRPSDDPADPADPLWRELLDGEVDPSTLGAVVPFDVVAATRAFLDDDVHALLDPAAFDEHGRLHFASSLAARAGYGEVPIVNRYVDLVGDVLRGALGLAGVPRWPDGRRAAIALSHDVDLPDRYAILRSALRPWRFRSMPRTYARASIHLARRRLHDPAPGDYWLFDPIMESEASLGFRSTFFLAATPYHRRWGVGWDVPYDVEERRFRDVMRRMSDEGFEIGLHAGYRTWEVPARFVQERALLSRIAGTPIRGVRHHYWHVGPDATATLRAHEQAGFEYDSSLAFNDHVGFRRGVALPFHPFDSTLGRPLSVLELPTFCMDGNFFYTSSDVDAAVATIDGLVSTIAGAGGLGVLDWHIQTSYPGNDDYREWGVAYQEILRLLSARKDVWVTGLGEIADWVSERARSLEASGREVAWGRA